MNRRAILKLFGLAAFAPALPAVADPSVEPPIVFPSPPPIERALDALAKQFVDPLFADVYFRGEKGERYRRTMPARAYPVPGGGVVVDFVSDSNMTMVSVEIRRGDNVLVTVFAAAMDTAHLHTGALIRINLAFDSRPTYVARLN